MKWNWQQKNWPEFRCDPSTLSELENCFLQQSGMLQGTLKHIGENDKLHLTVDLMSTEAINTSEIEGEILNRDSVQSSIRRNFGLDTDNQRIPPAEQGIAEMMVDLYQTYNEPLSHSKMFAWHKMLTSGRRDLTDIGCYRTHKDAMQVVSGAIHDPKVHFEAPPSKDMTAEMNQFIDWFNGCAPEAKNPTSSFDARWNCTFVLCFRTPVRRWQWSYRQSNFRNGAFPKSGAANFTGIVLYNSKSKKGLLSKSGEQQQRFGNIRLAFVFL